MSTSPQDKGDLWAGLEPEQPKSSRAAYWIALLATLFLLIGALAIGAFLLNQPGNEPSLPESTVVTDTGAIELTRAAETTSAEATAESSTESPTTGAITIAPTVTLPAQSAPSSQVTAGRMTTPPTIDAILNEWAGLPATTSTAIVYTSDTWDGSDDLEINWQLGWDEHNLYLAATIIDDIHAQNQSGNTIFRGDSLDVQVDTDRAGDFGPGLSPDDFQITFSAGDFAGLPPSAFRFQGTADGDMLDAPTPHNILMAAQSQPGGYILEAAIPWRDLNLVPFPGMELGLALNATDNDQPGTAIQEIMKSNSPNRVFGDPTTWGTMILQ